MTDKKEDLSDSDEQPDPNYFDNDDQQIDSGSKIQKSLKDKLKVKFSKTNESEDEDEEEEEEEDDFIKQ